jgi:hypothetical protein
MDVPKLKMTCDKCKVASTCPRNGQSPFQPHILKKPVYCQILGGYGRNPVNPRILSASSLARMQKDGPCLTLAEIPYLDAVTNTLRTEVVSVFSQPVRHPRETVPFNINLLYPKGGGGT